MGKVRLKATVEPDQPPLREKARTPFLDSPARRGVTGRGPRTAWLATGTAGGPLWSPVLNASTSWSRHGDKPVLAPPVTPPLAGESRKAVPGLSRWGGRRKAKPTGVIGDPRRPPSEKSEDAFPGDGQGSAEGDGEAGPAPPPRKGEDAFSRLPRKGGVTGRAREPLGSTQAPTNPKWDGRPAPYDLSASSTTRSAMARDEVRPGDSMPKRLTRPSTPQSSGPSIRKSGAGAPAGASLGRMPV